MRYQPPINLAVLSPGSVGARSLNRRATGTHYEQHARRYLEHHAGLTFVTANVNCCGSELDLIMRDEHTWVFVEVRYRKNAQFGSAAESVTPRKQQQLLHAATLWLAQRQQSFDTTSFRFDILAITGEHYDWLPNAFDA